MVYGFVGEILAAAMAISVVVGEREGQHSDYYFDDGTIEGHSNELE
jgi:hypothetical protein